MKPQTFRSTLALRLLEVKQLINVNGANFNIIHFTENDDELFGERKMELVEIEMEAK